MSSSHFFVAFLKYPSSGHGLCQGGYVFVLPAILLTCCAVSKVTIITLEFETADLPLWPSELVGRACVSVQVCTLLVQLASLTSLLIVSTSP